VNSPQSSTICRLGSNRSAPPPVSVSTHISSVHVSMLDMFRSCFSPLRKIWGTKSGTNRPASQPNHPDPREASIQVCIVVIAAKPHLFILYARNRFRMVSTRCGAAQAPLSLFHFSGHYLLYLYTCFFYPRRSSLSSLSSLFNFVSVQLHQTHQIQYFVPFTPWTQIDDSRRPWKRPMTLFSIYRCHLILEHWIAHILIDC
jgi:hypothetical protein